VVLAVPAVAEVRKETMLVVLEPPIRAAMVEAELRMALNREAVVVALAQTGEMATVPTEVVAVLV